MYSRFKSIGPVLVSLLAFGAVLSADSASAGFMVTVGNVTIQDGKQGDLDPRPNLIGFNANVNGYFANGTASQSLTPGFALITLTNLVVTQGGGAAAVLDSIVFESDPFAAIGPPSIGTIHLDGSCIKSALGAGQLINGCDVSLRGFINNGVNVGGVNAPVVANMAADVPFNPADQNFNPNVGVTMLRGRLTFSLGTNDGFFLPGSASVSLVPEPPTLVLLGTALTWMGLKGLRKRRPRYRPVSESFSVVPKEQ